MKDPSVPIFYGLALTWLLVSLVKDKKKAVQALWRAYRSFLFILPPFAVMILLISCLVVFLPKETIVTYIGEKSGFVGYFIASMVGSVTLIPGFVAFPLAKVLLENGAGIAQMAVFISTLMMVGVVTAPLESQYFRFHATLWRNLLAYFYSFVIGYSVYLFVR
ncbi:MAG: permease [Atribacterota bacterium]